MVEKRQTAPALAVAAALLMTALGATGCRDDGQAASETGGGSPATSTREDIHQPVVEGLQTAPESERVDLASPTFSDPTNVTNPLFPVSKQASVLLLGRVDGKPFRTEVTLLPETRIVEWQDRQVEVLVSQYVAYLGGRLHEVAYDLYAQDDAGAVWYFGEDVFNFKDGFIADTHGTWIAGKDGPAAMIMPADPQVGDVYRPENIPGFVFEEVTVKAVDQTLAGPLGPVEGGLLIQELHMDGFTEGKSFGPGYGEFFTGGGGDVEALALAVPTDARSEPTPAELVTLESGAADVFDAAASQNWRAARVAAREMNAAWVTVRAGEVPDRLEPQLDRSLVALTAAVGGRAAREARQAAIDVARWSLDLQLRHRPVPEVDLRPLRPLGRTASGGRSGGRRRRGERRLLQPRLHPGPDPAHAGRGRPRANQHLARRAQRGGRRGGSPGGGGRRPTATREPRRARPLTVPEAGARPDRPGGAPGCARPRR